MIRVITEACNASIQRRPISYHRKPVYWRVEGLAKLKRKCNQCWRKFQPNRKTRMVKEHEAYKEARRVLRLHTSKAECWKKLIDLINQDPWGLPYEIVMRKLRKSQAANIPEDELSLRKIVEVPFPFGRPRMIFPSETSTQTRKPFTLEELEAAAARFTSGKSPGLDF